MIPRKTNTRLTHTKCTIAATFALAMIALAAQVPAAGAEAPAASPPGTSDAAPAATPTQNAAVRNPRTARPRPGSIDYRVRLLTAELKLDAKQQQQVRRILEDQRAMTLKSWGDESVPSAVRVKNTQAISEKTADRIRAILDEKQRERYIKPIPPAAKAATSSANVETYMNATQRK